MNLATSYDVVANEYVHRIFDELRHKPLDRQLLDHLACDVGEGLICDMGCGPGHVARHLHEQGARVCGIDLSKAMVRRALELHPGIEFHRGDMKCLDVEDGSFAAITAFYSLIHIPRDQMVTVLRELRRVLRPDGLLLAAFHVGTETLHLDEWWDQAVCLDFHFFLVGEMQAWMETAGFEIGEVVEREPYPGIEHQSRRAYLFARRKEEKS